FLSLPILLYSHLKMSKCCMVMST
ncbi:ketodeoxygluconokinase, partial [Vibrio harveyi]